MGYLWLGQHLPRTLGEEICKHPPKMRAQPWSSLARMDQEELTCASGTSRVFTARSSLLWGNQPHQPLPGPAWPGRFLGTFGKGRFNPYKTHPAAGCDQTWLSIVKGRIQHHVLGTGSLQRRSPLSPGRQLRFFLCPNSPGAGAGAAVGQPLWTAWDSG